MAPSLTCHASPAGPTDDPPVPHDDPHDGAADTSPDTALDVGGPAIVPAAADVATSPPDGADILATTTTTDATGAADVAAPPPNGADILPTTTTTADAVDNPDADPDADSAHRCPSTASVTESENSLRTVQEVLTIAENHKAPLAEFPRDSPPSDHRYCMSVCCGRFSMTWTLHDPKEGFTPVTAWTSDPFPSLPIAHSTVKPHTRKVQPSKAILNCRLDSTSLDKNGIMLGQNPMNVYVMANNESQLTVVTYAFLAAPKCRLFRFDGPRYFPILESIGRFELTLDIQIAAVHAMDELRKQHEGTEPGRRQRRQHQQEQAQSDPSFLLVSAEKLLQSFHVSTDSRDNGKGLVIQSLGPVGLGFEEYTNELRRLNNMGKIIPQNTKSDEDQMTLDVDNAVLSASDELIKDATTKQFEKELDFIMKEFETKERQIISSGGNAANPKHGGHRNGTRAPSKLFVVVGEEAEVLCNTWDSTLSRCGYRSFWWPNAAGDAVRDLLKRSAAAEMNEQTDNDDDSDAPFVELDDVSIGAGMAPPIESNEDSDPDEAQQDNELDEATDDSLDALLDGCRVARLFVVEACSDWYYGFLRVRRPSNSYRSLKWTIHYDDGEKGHVNIEDVHEAIEGVLAHPEGMLPPHQGNTNSAVWKARMLSRIRAAKTAVIQRMEAEKQEAEEKKAEKQKAAAAAATKKGSASSTNKGRKRQKVERDA